MAKVPVRDVEPYNTRFIRDINAGLPRGDDAQVREWDVDSLTPNGTEANMSLNRHFHPEQKRGTENG